MAVEIKPQQSHDFPIELYGRLKLVLDDGHEIDLGRTIVAGRALLDIPEPDEGAPDEKTEGESPEWREGELWPDQRCKARYETGEIVGQCQMARKSPHDAGHDLHIDGAISWRDTDALAVTDANGHALH